MYGDEKTPVAIVIANMPRAAPRIINIVLLNALNDDTKIDSWMKFIQPINY